MDKESLKNVGACSVGGVTAVALVSFFVGVGYFFNYLHPQSTKKRTKIGEHTIIVERDLYNEKRRRLYIDPTNEVNLDSNYGLKAEDYNGNGRFDEVRLQEVEKGSPLEKYVSLPELERIFEKAMKEGEPIE